MKMITHRRVDRYCDLPSGVTLDGRLLRFESLSFGSRRVGYAVLGFYLLKTVDGGETWCCVRSVAPQGFAPRKVFSLGGMRCWVVCASTIGAPLGAIPVLVTEDGGKRWDIAWAGDVKARHGSKVCLFFTGESAGWLAATQHADKGQRAVILGTTDGGAHWQPVGEPVKFRPQRIFFPNADDGYLLAATAEQDRRRAFRADLANGDSRAEFLVGGHSGVLLRLTAAGVAADPVVQTRSSLYAIGAVDSGTIFMCGAGGRILRWDEGKNAAVRVGSGTRADLNDISFAERGSRSSGLAVGEEGAIIGTTDEGRTWHKLQHTIGKCGFWGVQMLGVSEAIVAASDAMYLLSEIE